MYLAPEDVAPLLRTFASLSPAGSRLFCDIPNHAAIDPSGVMAPHLVRLAAMGAPWRFATDEPHRVLSPAGWNVDEVLFAGHPRAWPKRLPWPAPSVPTPGSPLTWLVHATRAG
jgi:O-methyltransferase involved in polyketide biosynthesis